MQQAFITSYNIAFDYTGAPQMLNAAVSMPLLDTETQEFSAALNDNKITITLDPKAVLPADAIDLAQEVWINSNRVVLSDQLTREEKQEELKRLRASLPLSSPMKFIENIDKRILYLQVQLKESEHNPAVYDSLISRLRYEQGFIDEQNERQEILVSKKSPLKKISPSNHLRCSQTSSCDFSEANQLQDNLRLAESSSIFSTFFLDCADKFISILLPYMKDVVDTCSSYFPPNHPNYWRTNGQVFFPVATPSASSSCTLQITGSPLPKIIP